MDRRRLLLTSLLAMLVSSRPSQGQQRGKVYRIGMLERTSEAMNAANVEGFRRGLRELGYVEGTDFAIDYRSADGRDERFRDLAADLVRTKVDLIVTRGTPATVAAKQATTTIPIVVTGVGDAVRQGIVASLARPGANVTGLNPMVTELYPKHVEILATLVPRATRIAALFNMTNPANQLQWREVEAAARSLRLQAQLLDARKTEDLGPAFETAVRQHAESLLVGLDTVTLVNRQLIVRLAAQNRLPALYPSKEFAGGLAAYGVDYAEIYRRAAVFADKIFKGTKPGELPMEQPTKLELVVNLKTAKALGLTIPPSLLAQADQIIE
jgi:putative tryptophan/tyrosine transport system substrate-binding protein